MALVEESRYQIIDDGITEHHIQWRGQSYFRERLAQRGAKGILALPVDHVEYGVINDPQHPEQGMPRYTVTPVVGKYE